MFQSKQILKNNSFIDVKEQSDTKSSGGLLPHGLEDGLHLFPLLLGKVMGSDSLLEEFQASLLLTNSKRKYVIPCLVSVSPRVYLSNSWALLS